MPVTEIDNKAFETNAEENGRTKNVKNGTVHEDEVDQVTKAIGAGGRWQFRVFFIISIVGIFASWHMLVISFFAPNADHWCKPPVQFQNWSVEDWKEYAIPPDENNPDKLSSCKMYNRNYGLLPEENEQIDTNHPIVSCMYGWDFDRSFFEQSLENEFDLVCGREYLAKTGAAAYMAGILAGVVIFGQVSDIIGRRKTLLISFVTSLSAGIITAFMPTLMWFFTIRFFVAMGIAGLFTTGFVLAMEMVDGVYRTIIGIGIEFPWSFGFLVLSGLAYAQPNWRKLQLVIAVPVVVVAVFYWFVPESIRWLITRGRFEEAENIAKVAAKENKMDTNIRFVAAQTDTATTRTYTIINLFTSRKLCLRTLNLYFNWFVNAFVYYGLSLGTGSLGGNLFVTFAISGAIEIPAYAFSMWVLVYQGRRIPLCLTMVVGGIACLLTAAFEKGVYAYDWPIVTLAMIGKFGISASFAIVYVYSAEIYPTVVRNVGVGSSSMFARIGSMLAPYVALWGKVSYAIPLVIYGSFSVAAGLLVLVMPETNNKVLPQTPEEAEEFGKDEERRFFKVLC